MRVILIIVWIFVYTAQAASQDIETDTLRFARVELVNGEIITGVVVSYSDSVVVLSADFGQMSVYRRETRDLQLRNRPFRQEELEIERLHDFADDWHSDYHHILPTARPTGKGNVNYRVDYLLLHRLSFGLSANLSVEFGFELISPIASKFPFVWLQPKYSFGVADSYFSVGTYLGYAGGFRSGDEGMFLPFANYTIGSQYSNYTVGIAYRGSTEGRVNNPFLFNIGTNQRVSRFVSFSAELLLIGRAFNGEIGINVRTKDNLLLRLGLLRSWDTDWGVTFFPVLSITIPLR